MTPVEENSSSLDEKKIEPMEESKEESEEEEESIWDYFGRFPFVPLLFH